MATQNDTTTETNDDTLAEAPHFLTIIGDIEDRVRWAAGIAGIIIDAEVEQDVSSAAASIRTHLAECQQMIEGLCRWHRENEPGSNRDEEFNDHYTLLTGIVVTARQLFHEVNQPQDDSGKTAEQVSCALIELVDKLDAALYPKGYGGTA